MGSDFCGTVPAGSKVMVVWGELQAGGEALQVRPYPKVIWLQLTQESHEKLITCDSIGLRGGPSKASGRPAKVKLEQLTSVKPLKYLQGCSGKQLEGGAGGSPQVLLQRNLLWLRRPCHGKLPWININYIDSLSSFCCCSGGAQPGPAWHSWHPSCTWWKAIHC